MHDNFFGKLGTVLCSVRLVARACTEEKMRRSNHLEPEKGGPLEPRLADHCFARSDPSSASSHPVSSDLWGELSVPARPQLPFQVVTEAEGSHILPNARYDLHPQTLTSETLGAALGLAFQCFPAEEDREQIERNYHRFVLNERLYYEPALGREILLHADYLYHMDGGEIATVGCYQYPEEQDRVWLSWFGVHPSYRGNGIGAQVLAHIEDTALQMGRLKAAAYTEDCPENHRCHGFYEALGYKVVDSLLVCGDAMRVYEKALSACLE